MQPDEFNTGNASIRQGDRIYDHWSNVKVGDAQHQVVKRLRRRKGWKSSIIIRRFAFTFRLGQIWGYRGVFVERGREKELSEAVRKVKE